MQLIKNKKAVVMAVVIAVAVMAMILFGLASNAYAADGTDNNGTTPSFYCTYENADGDLVYGGDLAAGTYDVSFYTKDVETISAIEITTTYDTDVVTIGGVTGSTSALTSMGSVTDNGNLVIGYVSDGDYTAVDADAQYIATVQMTFAQDCDAKDYITVSENPNLTFIVADSTNGNYDDEYAVDTDYADYTNGVLSKMTYDLTPAVSSGNINISGKITIAATADGADSGAGLRNAEIIANPVLDGYGRIVGGTVVGTSNAEGDRSMYGNFDIDVPDGTTSIGIRGAATIDRVVALSDITDGIVIPVIVGDYNRDAAINAADFGEFIAYYSGTYHIYADFNADSQVNAADFGSFISIYSAGEVTYE